MMGVAGMMILSLDGIIVGVHCNLIVAIDGILITGFICYPNCGAYMISSLSVYTVTDSILIMGIHYILNIDVHGILIVGVLGILILGVYGILIMGEHISNIEERM